MLHKICALRRHIHEPVKVRDVILLLGIKTLEANRIGQLGGCLLAGDGGEALVQLGIKEHPSVPAVGPIGGCPGGGGVVVKVLTVARDTRSIDDLADLGKDPLTALGIAEIDDAALEPASFGYT